MCEIFSFDDDQVKILRIDKPITSLTLINTYKIQQ